MTPHDASNMGGGETLAFAATQCVILKLCPGRDTSGSENYPSL